MIMSANVIKSAIYIRVSTNRQVDDGISIESQYDVLTEYCKDNNYDVYDVYIDAGKSGKTTSNRDEFKRMINDAKQHKFNILVIWKISRFGRNFNDLILGSKVLMDNYINIISYSEHFDLNTAIGRLVFNILSSVANFEIDEYSENIKMVFDAKAKRGGRMCHFVLGYDPLGRDSFIVNTYEAYIVFTIFSIYNYYENLTQTADYINSLGFVGKNGNKFSSCSIKEILKRSLYCGFVEHNGIIYKGLFKNIITIKLYNDTQIKLYKNGQSRSKMKLYIIDNNKQVFLNDYVVMCYDKENR